MRCPYCPAELSLLEYAWAHTHPTKVGRWCGIGMMMVGGFIASVGLLEVTGVVQ